MSGTHVITFYRFVAPGTLPPERLAALQGALQTRCEAGQVLGTVLLAQEGINGTLCGAEPALDTLCGWLRAQPEWPGLPVKWSRARADQAPFGRLKVRVKDEIVSLGAAVDPVALSGEPVGPERFNELLDDPTVLVIDTRNHYEIEAGGFPGALNPGTDSFREFPGFAAQLDPEQQPRVAMFCTGGIRCEKASGYLLAQGFEAVYQLDGGILNYLDTVEPAASRWRGDCFVFDQRVALTPALEPGDYVQCHACRRPLTPADTAHPDYEPGVRCADCAGFGTDTGRTAPARAG